MKFAFLDYEDLIKIKSIPYSDLKVGLHVSGWWCNNPHTFDFLSVCKFTGRITEITEKAIRIELTDSYYITRSDNSQDIGSYPIGYPVNISRDSLCLPTPNDLSILRYAL